MRGRKFASLGTETRKNGRGAAPSRRSGLHLLDDLGRRVARLGLVGDGVDGDEHALDGPVLVAVFVAGADFGARDDGVRDVLRPVGRADLVEVVGVAVADVMRVS